MNGHGTRLASIAAAMAICTTASAQEAGVFRDADAAMTCGQIGDEAAMLSAAMGDAAPRGGWLSALGGVARSGASLLLPGGSLAVAGVDAVRQPAREQREAQATEALNRWYYLNGLHAGRGCRDPASPSIEPGVLSPTPQTGR